MRSITPRRGQPFTPDMGRRSRVLVVEDDGLVAIVVKNLLVEIGCEVVGPVVDREAATAFIESGSLEAGVVDHVREGDHDYTVEDCLARHHVPFGLVLGGASVVTERHRDRPSIVKPFTLEALYAFLATVLADSSAST